MKWLVRVVILVLVAFAAVAVAGALVPSGHQAASTIVLRQPPQAVFDALIAFDRHGEWREVESLVRLPDLDGLPYWRETGPMGVMDFVVEDVRPPHHFQTRIVSEDLPFGGRWIYDIDALPEGSAVTITEDGDVKNVVFRGMAHFVFGYHATQQQYLRDLAARFDEDAEPTEAEPRVKD